MFVAVFYFFFLVFGFVDEVGADFTDEAHEDAFLLLGEDDEVDGVGAVWVLGVGEPKLSASAFVDGEVVDEVFLVELLPGLPLLFV